MNIWKIIKLIKEECKQLEKSSKIGSTVTDKSIDELVEIMKQCEMECINAIEGEK